MKNVVSAEITARRKFQQKTEKLIDRLVMKQDDELFSIRKEMLHIAGEIGGRVQNFETTLSNLLKDSREIKDYTRDAIIHLREDNHKLQVQVEDVSAKLMPLLKKLKSIDSELSLLESKTDDLHSFKATIVKKLIIMMLE